MTSCASSSPHVGHRQDDTGARVRRRGYSAYDADDDGFSEPRTDGRWAWRADAVAELLAQHTTGLLLFAGCPEEQSDLPFHFRVLLTTSDSVLSQRLG